MHVLEYQAVIQEIRITWSKASRGGLAAGQRNQVGHALLLPLERVDKSDWFLFEHQAFYNERNGFTHPTIYGGSYTHSSVFNVKHLNMTFELKQVQVTWAHETPVGRGTDYVPVHKLLFTLGVDEWGQVVYNYKVGHTSFEKTIINVGAFTTVTEDVFTRSGPTHTFKKVNPLY